MHFADDPETQVSGSSDVEGGDVSTAGQSYTKQAASDMLHGIVTSLMEFYDSSPAEFHYAVEAAHRNVQRLQTASSVVSALHNFAKTPGTMALSVRGRNRAAIPVQPTALHVESQHLVGGGVPFQGGLQNAALSRSMAILTHDRVQKQKCVP